MQQRNAPITGQIDRENASAASSSVILATKLYRPPLSADLESRGDLITRLENNRHRALTLISAPTGYGKSTLASMWFDASETPGCWVSLDEEDDDPRMFVGYMIAAIQSMFPEIRLHTQNLLQTNVFPLPSTVARTLLNDLERIPQRILLALDDLHLIQSQAVFDIIAELLRHPSPNLHLVLIGRRDPPLPLPLLRARRQITEIRTRELRFSIADTAGFLTKMLDREIDAATATAWTERTEGWVTALGLAAISLRQCEAGELNPDDVPVDTYYLQEYLLVEVINRLDPILKKCLMAVAWLDRFCPALCTAVCQADSAANETDPTGEAVIQRLQRDNLFIIPLDDENHWFRLHHLFQSLLQNWGRQHYSDAEIAGLRRRAGVWFAQQGLPDDAIRYLVAAGDYAAAEQLVEQHRYALMDALQWSRLARWLGYFPSSLLERSALLMSAAAVVSLHSGQHEEAAVTAQKTEQLLASLSSPSSQYDALLGEVSTVKVILAVASGDAQAVATHAERSARLLPTDALVLRSVAYGGIAASRQMSGQFTEGCRFLEEIISEPQWTQPIRIRLMHYLCILSFMQGDLPTTEAWAGRIAEIAQDHDYSVALSTARYFLGAVHYLRHNFDTAEPYLCALLEDHAVATTSYLNMGTFALASIRNSRGDFIQADAIIDQIRTHFQSARNAFALNTIQAFTVELAWRRNDLEAAHRMAIGVDFHSRFPLWLFYIPRLTPIKLQLAEGTPDALTAARATLEELAQRMTAIHLNIARTDILALLALVCDAQGDDVAAEANLSIALTLAQEGGLIQPFVDLGTPMAKQLQRHFDRDEKMSETTRAFARQVLAAFATVTTVPGAQTASAESGVHRAPTGPLPLDPLTPRESEILQQLAGDVTPAEIAAQSVVSVSTVRSQIKSIYRKLDVHNRMEAVNRGREAGIL